MSKVTWRDRARPIIARVLTETVGQSEPEIKRALRAAYPFGERANHPYQIWLSEIRIQRGLKKSPYKKGEKKQVESSAGQGDLFQEKSA